MDTVWELDGLLSTMAFNSPRARFTFCGASGAGRRQVSHKASTASARRAANGMPRPARQPQAQEGQGPQHRHPEAETALTRGHCRRLVALRQDLDPRGVVQLALGLGQLLGRGRRLVRLGRVDLQVDDVLQGARPAAVPLLVLLLPAQLALAPPARSNSPFKATTMANFSVSTTSAWLFSTR